MITHWSLGLFVLTHIQSCISAVSNHTIDDSDEKGDLVTGIIPTYTPQKAWNHVFDGDCNVCTIKPDPNRAMNHTWHDTTAQNDSPSSVNMTFTGTAIYIFGIVPNNAASRPVNLTFTLDGAVVEPGYTHLPDNSSGIEYNVPMFVAEGLGNVSHTLVMRTASSPSVFLFDYARYTFDDGITAGDQPATGGGKPGDQSTTAGSKSHTAVIVGSICGVAVVAAVLSVLVYLKRRKRRRSESGTGPEAPVIDPYFPLAPQTREFTGPDAPIDLPPYTPLDPSSSGSPATGIPSRIYRKQR